MHIIGAALFDFVQDNQLKIVWQQSCDDFGRQTVEKEHKAMEVIHVVLRPAFAICLFLSQFTSNRTSFFTDDPYLLSLGAVFIVAGLSLLIAASIHLRRADEIVTSGPFRYIRHPIYVSIYILSIGLGLIFFAWIWFLVLIVFIPLWWLECKSEEKEMKERYGEEYVAYQERTDMFIPGVL